ncbi:glycosyltransferase [Natronococcus occultus]|nr:glycosyltransferase [Natronococcus occultus]
MNARDGPRPTQFSVLIPVYEKNDASQVDDALESTISQTTPPDQMVVVVDGPVPTRVDETIHGWSSEHPETVDVVQLEENRGLENALNVGLERCDHELVARMDADDVSSETRFERQLEVFRRQPDVDVVGGYVGEFVDDPDQVSHVRTVPTAPAEIERFARFRSPINHPTVMYKKSQVQAAGGYRTIPGVGDYELWVRLLERGNVLRNVPAVLVYMRAGAEMYRRRGGIGYARTEFRLQKEFLERGFIPPRVFLLNVGLRIPLRLLPNGARRLLYSRFLR